MLCIACGTTIKRSAQTMGPYHLCVFCKGPHVWLERRGQVIYYVDRASGQTERCARREEYLSLLHLGGES